MNMSQAVMIILQCIKDHLLFCKCMIWCVFFSHSTLQSSRIFWVTNACSGCGNICMSSSLPENMWFTVMLLTITCIFYSFRKIEKPCLSIHIEKNCSKLSMIIRYFLATFNAFANWSLLVADGYFLLICKL
jgi:hypothetical protein